MRSKHCSLICLDVLSGPGLTKAGNRLNGGMHDFGYWVVVGVDPTTWRRHGELFALIVKGALDANVPPSEAF